MCAEVQILFPHKKQDDSVISLQRFKLPGLGSVSNVAPKQNKIKEEDIIIIVTGQNGRPLEIENKVNLVLLIKKWRCHLTS